MANVEITNNQNGVKIVSATLDKGYPYDYLTFSVGVANIIIFDRTLIIVNEKLQDISVNGVELTRENAYSLLSKALMSSGSSSGGGTGTPVQSDYAETDDASPAFIKNKPISSILESQDLPINANAGDLVTKITEDGEISEVWRYDGFIWELFSMPYNLEYVQTSVAGLVTNLTGSTLAKLSNGVTYVHYKNDSIFLQSKICASEIKKSSRSYTIGELVRTFAANEVVYIEDLSAKTINIKPAATTSAATKTVDTVKVSNTLAQSIVFDGFANQAIFLDVFRRDLPTDTKPMLEITAVAENVNLKNIYDYTKITLNLHKLSAAATVNSFVYVDNIAGYTEPIGGTIGSIISISNPTAASGIQLNCIVDSSFTAGISITGFGSGSTTARVAKLDLSKMVFLDKFVNIYFADCIFTQPNDVLSFFDKLIATNTMRESEANIRISRTNLTPDPARIAALQALGFIVSWV